MIISTTLTMLVNLSLHDRIFIPLACRYTDRQSGISYFQRMGAGLAVSVLGVLAGALAEGKQQRVAAEHGLLDSLGATMPIIVSWLVPQYMLHGVSDALSTAVHMEFRYDQSPESMRAGNHRKIHAAARSPELSS
ncbi:Peptide transporter PTR2 [Hordeum vulgare]|nr:Peptide transporter PTR2 [Hordeum vulgare]